MRSPRLRKDQRYASRGRIEQLESRCLLAGLLGGWDALPQAVSLDSRDIPIYEGTDGDDVILVSLLADDPTRMAIRINDAPLQIVPESERLHIRAGAGNDFVRVDGDFSVLIEGGDGNDVLISDSGDDGLSGGEGDDVLDSGPGNDYLLGDNGNDRLLGGGGDDRLYGDSRSDAFGKDVLIGGPGDDYLAGGNGKDMLLGESGDDRLESAIHGNWCNRQRSTLTPLGWSHLTTLIGCGLIAEDGEPDVVEGGSGYDVALVSREEGDIVSEVEEFRDPGNWFFVNYDVNQDGRVTSLDVVLIINHIDGDRTKPGPLSDFLRRFDLNGDDHVSGTDALLIINRLTQASNVPPLSSSLVDEAFAAMDEEDDDPRRIEHDVRSIETHV